MNVYLHIGFPKTGSTAIQSHIFANQGWFEQRGIYIPQAGYSSGLGHCFLLAAQQSRRAQLDEHQRSEFAATQRQLREELQTSAAAGYRAALLSWEGFALLGQEDIQALSSALEGHQVQLLAYVRDQVSLYESLTLQRAKQFDFGPLLRTPEAEALVASLPAYLNFYDVFRSWEAHFHSGLSVAVRVFNRQYLGSGDVVVDFLSWLGLEQDAEFALESGVINESLDSRSALMLAIAKSAGVNFVRLGKLSRALMAATAATGSSGSSFLDDASRQRIADNFSASNRRFFVEFPPENIPAQSQGFEAARTRAQQGASGSVDVAFARALQAALANPLVASWSGGLLSGRRLELITDDPSRGWRGSEETGVWSMGETSELRFRPPLTHVGAGPVALCLCIQGVYFDGHVKTQVRYANFDNAVDLRSAELLIPLDESVPETGIKVVLQHDMPASAEGAAPDPKALAYKLRLANYRFVWA